MFVCSCSDGLAGYDAATECKNDHVERPSSFTSGGQSFGYADSAELAVALEAATPAAAKLAKPPPDDFEFDEETDLEPRFAILKSNNVLHDRHLYYCKS
jgi:hypothetical protein